MLECNCIETNTRAGGLTERTILGLLFSRVDAQGVGVGGTKGKNLKNLERTALARGNLSR